MYQRDHICSESKKLKAEYMNDELSIDEVLRG